MRKNTRSTAVAVILAAAAIIMASNPALGCSRVKPFLLDELFVADAIVVATAESYVGTPDLSITTTGVPDTQVEFKVTEILRGKNIGTTIILNGYLGADDDFNDQEVPYKFVRDNGRSGSCFANTYKKGGEFLLFLKRNENGYTPNISALGPNNEQLHSANDPWLSWVKKELAQRKKM